VTVNVRLVSQDVESVSTTGFTKYNAPALIMQALFNPDNCNKAHWAQKPLPWEYFSLTVKQLEIPTE